MGRAGPIDAGQDGIGSIGPEWVVIGTRPEGVCQDVAVQIRPEDGAVPPAPAMPGGTRVMVAPPAPRVLAAEGVVIELIPLDVSNVVKLMNPRAVTNAIVAETGRDNLAKVMSEFSAADMT